MAWETYVFLLFKSNDGLNWKELLKIKSAHKLLYALEIIEALGKPNRRIRRESTVIVFLLLSLHICIHSGAKFQSMLSFNSRIIFSLAILSHSYFSPQGSYSDLYPDSDDSSEDQVENSKNSWSCKVGSCVLQYDENNLFLIFQKQIPRLFIRFQLIYY